MGSSEFIDVSWVALKSSMVSKSIQSTLQWLEEPKAYYLYLFDGPFKLRATIDKTAPINGDQFDFELNFKEKSNNILEPRDSDNSPLSRTKVTKTGWQYQVHSLEFTTAKLNSFYNKNLDAQDLGFTSLKLFKADNSEITTQEEEPLAVKTIVTWEPLHILEILGGDYHQAAPPNTDVRMWVRGLPHIPAQYGGSKDFLQGGINLRYVPVGAVVRADGRAPKELPYDPGKGYTRLSIYLRHDAGVQHTGQMVFELFRP